MKRTGLLFLAGLCALPAHGADATLPEDVLHTLTAIDTFPSREMVADVLRSPSNEIVMLRHYALSSTLDFGARLRAVRVIPHFCSDQRTECRQAILDVLDNITTTAVDSPGQRILRRRAAIEALGAIRSVQPEDISLLADFLGDPSRDIRVAAARALRDLCDPAAISALQRQRDAPNEVPQVIYAIEEAIAAIARCGP